MSSSHLASFLVIILTLPGILCQRRNQGFFLNPDAFSSANVRSTSRKLNETIQTSCLKDRIYVTFSQQKMMELGILPNQISLEDRQCLFTSNVTHYVAEIMFRTLTCGSRHTRDRVNGLHTIDNSVIFMPPDITNTSLTDDEDDFQVEAGSGDEEEEMKDELHVITIQFYCQYSRSELPLFSTASTSDSLASASGITFPSLTEKKVSPRPKKMRTNRVDESFAMELYATSSYTYPLATSMLLRVTTGMELFVQVTPNISLYDSAFLHNCYYSELEMSEGPRDRDLTYLIKNGCPRQSSVDFLDEYFGSKEQRFKFLVEKLHNSWAFLRCELQPCTFEGSSPNFPQCESQMDYCRSKPFARKELHTVTWPHSKLVNSNQPSYAQQGGNRDAPSITSDCPLQFVEIPCNCENVGLLTDTEVSNQERAGVSLWTVAIIALGTFCLGMLLMVLFCFTVGSHKKKTISKCNSQSSNESVEYAASRKLMEEPNLNSRGPQIL